ncbi:MAG: DUF1178 family protein [Proteobacteria bacterium]|nr:DUF1178 family protein [Pseudomonadota bacterium]MBU4470704.1 DUF1178 family protein [Pseudomonadota bacterium]MCG2751200.1 DUF1178 family protein [Desulfobacteraceae bacterium]
MIVFDLKCGNGHTFEGWFDDNKAFLQQKKKGLIACPVCNDGAVEKKLSTFGIKSAQGSNLRVPGPDDMAAFAQKITEFVDKNFEDVGCDFTKEALKIHYGASEPRNIKGVSTEAEEKILKDEGVEFVKIPVGRAPEPNSEN